VKEKMARKSEDPSGANALEGGSSLLAGRTGEKKLQPPKGNPLGRVPGPRLIRRQSKAKARWGTGNMLKGGKKILGKKGDEYEANDLKKTTTDEKIALR